MMKSISHIVIYIDYNVILEISKQIIIITLLIIKLNLRFIYVSKYI